MHFDFGIKGKFYVEGKEFVASDEDTANVVKYFGFVAYTGQFIIMKEDDTTPTAITYRFATGNTGYGVAWTGRAALTYTTYDQMTAAF